MLAARFEINLRPFLESACRLTQAFAVGVIICWSSHHQLGFSSTRRFPPYSRQIIFNPCFVTSMQIEHVTFRLPCPIGLLTQNKSVTILPSSTRQKMECNRVFRFSCLPSLSRGPLSRSRCISPSPRYPVASSSSLGLCLNIPSLTRTIQVCSKYTN